MLHKLQQFQWSSPLAFHLQDAAQNVKSMATVWPQKTTKIIKFQ